MNERIGRLMGWLVLLTVLVSASNAIARYGWNRSSNAWLELQWYLFGAVFLLGAGYTLKSNEHIRIDIINSRLSQRSRNIVELIGHFLFLLPLCVLMLYLSIPFFWRAFLSGEVSANAAVLRSGRRSCCCRSAFFSCSFRLSRKSSSASLSCAG